MTGIGARLIDAREARGLTLEDAERDTRISRRYLQALEDEEFDVIPAPVYARGFLRSYSQYIGLDPQEMLSLFPREDGPAQRVPSQTPASFTPHGGSGGGASKPAWRRPQADPDGGRQQVVGGSPYPAQARMPERTPTPFERPGQHRPEQERPAPRPISAPGPTYEPTIGVDIGVPQYRGTTPAVRIKRDPAAQARTLTVGIVAIVGIVGIILLALFISRLGGGGDDPATSFNNSGAIPADGTTATDDTDTATQTDTQGQPSGLSVTPGVVPNLVGQTAATARSAIEEAGFPVTEVTDTNAEFAEGVVFDQAPSPGTEQAADIPVIISVSEGP